MSNAPLLSAIDLCCARGGSLGAVQGVSAAFYGPGITLLTGSPGSGHHLLLRLLCLMEAPESGEIALLGEPTGGWSEAQRADARNRHFGFLFHSPFLLPSFNVVENVAMPYFKLRDAAPEEAQQPMREVLELVGLEAWAEEEVETLSLEMQHRAALARALITRPEVIVIEAVDRLLRDAPLIAFLELLAEARDRFGVLFLLSTDTAALAGFADRVIGLEAGGIVHDRAPKRFFS